LRREFFDSNKLISHYVSDESAEDINVDRIFDTKFDKNLQVQTDEQNPSLVTVSFRDANPELAAKLLNQIIEFSNKRTSQQFVDDVDSAIQAEIEQIRRKLDSKLELARDRRHDKIINLKEALRVAKALGIKENGIFPNNLQQSQTGLAVNTAETPLYMRGTEALETEIDVLESRKSDEPFIAGFRDLQERRAFLGSVSIDPDSLSAVTLDETARVPYRREKPRVALVILLASMLGIFVAAFVVLIAESLSRPR
jgi:chain length determinant protein (polysaccharide antigen chain regulator)